ncbi:MAG: hypothetical protein ACK4OO_01165 [bacterium]
MDPVRSDTLSTPIPHQDLRKTLISEKVLQAIQRVEKTYHQTQQRPSPQPSLPHLGRNVDIFV